jgi:hypothetical protein
MIKGIMRKVWIPLLLLGLGLVVFNQWRLARQVRTLTAERDAALQSETPSLPQSQSPGSELKEAQGKLEQANLELAAARQKLADLQTKVAAFEHKPAATSVTADILPNSPTPAEPPQPSKRSWGPEQATGPPDTAAGGDLPTAWASLEPSAGVEWLKLDYQSVVNIAQIRVRETFNPGAVFKITALVPGGQEFTVWQGTENAGPAPYDSVFDVPGSIYAQSVKIYLDSTRVPGWNEIDAVELIGKDGSHQWATSASASSTYAERPATPVASSSNLDQLQQ